MILPEEQLFGLKPFTYEDPPVVGQKAMRIAAHNDALPCGTVVTITEVCIRRMEVAVLTEDGRDLGDGWDLEAFAPLFVEDEPV